MNVTYACSRCEQLTRNDVATETATLNCTHCGQSVRVPTDAWDGGQLQRCLVCPSTELFVRKDFPQRLGVALVAIGIIGSSVAWAYTFVVLTFAILFATALADVVLYLIVPDALMCYRCGAQYRPATGIDRHGAFNLETHERHRQQKARMIGQSQ
jgi:hypothetical protein